MRRRLGLVTAYLQTRSRRFSTREALLSWQARRLRIALTRAVRTFPAYAGLPARLDAFPTVDKADWLDRFEDFNAAGLTLTECLGAARAAESGRDFTATLRGLSVGLSTGTSGRQGVFLTSPAERDRWAGTILAKALPRGLLAGAKVALFLRAGGPLYEAVGSGRVQFRFFDLALPLEGHDQALDDFAPTVLAAPPVVLERLAARLAAGRSTAAPERVYSIADVLDADVRARIEAGFRRPIGQIYQATEGFLGITCDRGTLHLNEDLLHFELTDLGQSRVAPVVTDLYRTSQAIIRYRLGDVLVLGAPCPCGSVCTPIEAIEGRADDVLRFGDQAIFADFVRGAVLGAQGVADFGLTQTEDGLQLAVTPALAWPGARDALASLLAAHEVSARIEPAPFVVQSPAAKRRRVRRIN